MSKINFEIRRKITDRKVVSIEANNFKAAIKEFAETYDMPIYKSNKNISDDRETFIAVHDLTKIEFKYVYLEEHQGYVEYKWKDSIGKININKKGDRTWVGYFEF